MSVKLRWKTLKGGKLSPYLDIYYNGQRQYEFLKIKIDPRDPDAKEQKELAKKIRVQRENQIVNEDHGYIPLAYKNANFIEYFQGFVNNYTKPGVRKYRYSLEKFKKYLGTDRIPFRKLTPEVCIGFKEFLYNAANGLSGETPYDYFKRFTAVLNSAVQEKIIRENPASHIRVTREQNQLKKQILTIEELRILMQTHCGNEQVKSAFLFSCYTGLGMAELRVLEWGDIQQGGSKLVLSRKKTNKPIVIPIKPDALKFLGDSKGRNQKIFQLPSDTAINNGIKRWVKRAGIDKHITSYCGRHTYATLLLKHSNVNPKTLVDLLGQSSFDYVAKYLNYTDELKERAVGDLPSILGD